MPATVNGSRVDVAAEVAEVALDALPGAACGDAELLVVVALGAARGERVAEPEAVVERDPVGGVRERRSALVGRDHEVRIVLVESAHARRMHDLAGDDVVGQVEQPADEHRVAELHLGAQRSRSAGGAAQHEAALRADRDDHGVLDRLGLHQPEHLGAVVLPAVRPADAAARHVAATQVDALDQRVVDEDLVERRRLGHLRHIRRAQLEREIRAAEGRIGAHGGVHERCKAAQDAILVETADGRELLLELVHAAPPPAPRRRDRRSARGTTRQASGP